jgi:hypothetical protein
MRNFHHGEHSSDMGDGSPIPKAMSPSLKRLL